ncbi:MAG: hypothetical protein OSB69_17720 [Alphaproteobacteria bacterium]|nr:hypothetical protein [Alphaproteobacteria bacterium]
MPGFDILDRGHRFIGEHPDGSEDWLNMTLGALDTPGGAAQELDAYRD